MGARVSHESDSRQNAFATGDQFDDGVAFEQAILMGAPANLTVTVNVPAVNPAGQHLTNGGFLDGWIDFNRDGVWDDPANPNDDFEHVVALYRVVPGANTVTITIPAASAADGITAGDVFARFRFSTTGSATPTGEAPNGEVEDYRMRLVEFLEDYGDAPSPFPTMLAENGPRHQDRSVLGPVPGLGDRRRHGRPADGERRRRRPGQRGRRRRRRRLRHPAGSRRNRQAST